MSKNKVGINNTNSVISGYLDVFQTYLKSRGFGVERIGGFTDVGTQRFRISDKSGKVYEDYFGVEFSGARPVFHSGRRTKNDVYRPFLESVIFDTVKKDNGDTVPFLGYKSSYTAATDIIESAFTSGGSDIRGNVLGIMSDAGMPMVNPSAGAENILHHMLGVKLVNSAYRDKQYDASNKLENALKTVAGGLPLPEGIVLQNNVPLSVFSGIVPDTKTDTFQRVSVSNGMSYSPHGLGKHTQSSIPQTVEKMVLGGDGKYRLIEPQQHGGLGYGLPAAIPFGETSLPAGEINNVLISSSIYSGGALKYEYPDLVSREEEDYINVVGKLIKEPLPVSKLNDILSNDIDATLRVPDQLRLPPGEKTVNLASQGDSDITYNKTASAIILPGGIDNTEVRLPGYYIPSKNNKWSRGPIKGSVPVEGEMLDKIAKSLGIPANNIVVDAGVNVPQIVFSGYREVTAKPKGLGGKEGVAPMGVERFYDGHQITKYSGEAKTARKIDALLLGRSRRNFRSILDDWADIEGGAARKLVDSLGDPNELLDMNVLTKTYNALNPGVLSDGESIGPHIFKKVFYDADDERSKYNKEKYGIFRAKEGSTFDLGPMSQSEYNAFVTSNRDVYGGTYEDALARTQKYLTLKNGNAYRVLGADDWISPSFDVPRADATQKGGKVTARDLKSISDEFPKAASEMGLGAFNKDFSTLSNREKASRDLYGYLASIKDPVSLRSPRKEAVSLSRDQVGEMLRTIDNYRVSTQAENASEVPYNDLYDKLEEIAKTNGRGMQLLGINQPLLSPNTMRELSYETNGISRSLTGKMFVDNLRDMLNFEYSIGGQFVNSSGERSVIKASDVAPMADSIAKKSSINKRLLENQGGELLQDVGASRVPGVSGNFSGVPWLTSQHEVYLPAEKMKQTVREMYPGRSDGWIEKNYKSVFNGVSAIGVRNPYSEGAQFTSLSIIGEDELSSRIGAQQARNIERYMNRNKLIGVSSSFPIKGLGDLDNDPMKMFLAVKKDDNGSWVNISGSDAVDELVSKRLTIDDAIATEKELLGNSPSILNEASSHREATKALSEAVSPITKALNKGVAKPFSEVWDSAKYAQDAKSGISAAYNWGTMSLADAVLRNADASKAMKGSQSLYTANLDMIYGISSAHGGHIAQQFISANFKKDAKSGESILSISEKDKNIVGGLTWTKLKLSDLNNSSKLRSFRHRITSQVLAPEQIGDEMLYPASNDAVAGWFAGSDSERDVLLDLLNNAEEYDRSNVISKYFDKKVDALGPSGALAGEYDLLTSGVVGKFMSKAVEGSRRSGASQESRDVMDEFLSALPDKNRKELSARASLYRIYEKKHGPPSASELQELRSVLAEGASREYVDNLLYATGIGVGESVQYMSGARIEKAEEKHLAMSIASGLYEESNNAVGKKNVEDLLIAHGQQSTGNSINDAMALEAAQLDSNAGLRVPENNNQSSTQTTVQVKYRDIPRNAEEWTEFAKTYTTRHSLATRMQAEAMPKIKSIFDKYNSWSGDVSSSQFTLAKKIESGELPASSEFEVKAQLLPFSPLQKEAKWLSEKNRMFHYAVSEGYTGVYSVKASSIGHAGDFVSLANMWTSSIQGTSEQIANLFTIGNTDSVRAKALGLDIGGVSSDEFFTNSDNLNVYRSLVNATSGITNAYKSPYVPDPIRKILGAGKNFEINHPKVDLMKMTPFSKESFSAVLESRSKNDLTQLANSLGIRASGSKSAIVKAITENIPPEWQEATTLGTSLGAKRQSQGDIFRALELNEFNIDENMQGWAKGPLSSSSTYRRNQVIASGLMGGGVTVDQLDRMSSAWKNLNRKAKDSGFFGQLEQANSLFESIKDTHGDELKTIAKQELSRNVVPQSRATFDSRMAETVEKFNKVMLSAIETEKKYNEIRGKVTKEEEQKLNLARKAEWKSVDIEAAKLADMKKIERRELDANDAGIISEYLSKSTTSGVTDKETAEYKAALKRRENMPSDIDKIDRTYAIDSYGDDGGTSKMGSIMRRALGGFGMMYMKAIGGYITSGLGAHEQEAVAYQTKMAQTATSMFGGDTIIKNTGRELSELYGVLGPNANSLTEARIAIARNAPVLGDISSTAGAGIGAWGMSQWVGDMMKGSKNEAVFGAGEWLTGRGGLLIAGGVAAANLAGRVYEGTLDQRSLAIRSSRFSSDTPATALLHPIDVLSYGVLNEASRADLLSEEKNFRTITLATGGDVIGYDEEANIRSDGVYKVDNRSSISKLGDVALGLMGVPAEYLNRNGAEYDKLPNTIQEYMQRTGKSQAEAFLDYSSVYKLNDRTGVSADAISFATALQLENEASWKQEKVSEIAMRYQADGGASWNLAQSLAIMEGGGQTSYLYEKKPGSEFNNVSDIYLNKLDNLGQKERSIIEAGASFANKLTSTRYLFRDGIQTDSVEYATRLEGLSIPQKDAIISADNAWSISRYVNVGNLDVSMPDIKRIESMSEADAAEYTRKQNANAAVLSETLATSNSIRSSMYQLGMNNLGDVAAQYIESVAPSNQKYTSNLFNLNPLTIARELKRTGMSIGQLDSINAGQTINGDWLSAVDTDMSGNFTGLSWGQTSFNLNGKNMAEQWFGSDWRNSRAAGVLSGGIDGFTLDSGRVVGGMFGIQGNMKERAYQMQLEQFNLSQESFNLNVSATRKGWVIQDQLRELGYRQQEWNFDFGDRQRDRQAANFEENQALSQRGRDMSRAWTYQSWAFDDEIRGKKWEWQKEDFAEESRFMTGRQRKLAERSMERNTELHNLEEEQILRVRQEKEESWKLEDERVDIQRKQFEENLKAQEEQSQAMRKFFEERKVLERKQTDLTRSTYEKSIEIQRKSSEMQRKFMEQRHDDEMALFSLEKEMQISLAKQATLTEDALGKVVSRLLEIAKASDTITSNNNYNYTSDDDFDLNALKDDNSVVSSTLDILSGLSSLDSDSYFIPAEAKNTDANQTVSIYIGDEHLKDVIINAVDNEIRI